MSVLRLSFRPLGDSFHGRGDGGEPEWPPSPLRAFQALVAAVAGRWRGAQYDGYADPALRWLEGLGPPEVYAPTGRPAARPYRLYVPNNAGDLMVSAWARGDADASMAGHRTEKDVRPTRFDDGGAVHYDWPLTPEQHEPAGNFLPMLRATARSVTHLGWGVDMVAADAGVVSPDSDDTTSGERWLPVGDGSGTPFRVPRSGTLAMLRTRHTAFLGRLPRTGGFVPVPPLTAFDTVCYRRDSDPAPRPWAAFGILTPEAEKNASFDTPRRCADVAAWVRHATGQACTEWPDAATFVHGHAADGTQAKGHGADARLMYLPLPTINHALGRVESIRRVLVAAPPGYRDRVIELRRRLAGQEIVRLSNEPVDPKDRVVGVLNLLPSSDWVLNQYVRPARVWTTVTPVLRPGFDDRDPDKAERLLRKAFADAGLPPPADLAWRGVGFRAGVDHAVRYEPPQTLDGYPRMHVRVTWPTPVPGPVAVGAGRYRGFGVFVSEPGS